MSIYVEYIVSIYVEYIVSIYVEYIVSIYVESTNVERKYFYHDQSILCKKMFVFFKHHFTAIYKRHVLQQRRELLLSLILCPEKRVFMKV